MAIFEKHHANKLLLDDTEAVKCTIENAYNVNGHTEYSIKVQRGQNEGNVWVVSRRYNDFGTLNSILQSANINVSFPPKKILGNMSSEFIAERRIDLQVYLNALIKNIVVSNSLPFKMFIDPKNYPQSLNELALQSVSMALRGDGNYQLINSLHEIGWRVRKHYYLVSKSENIKDNYIMHWQTYGPDRSLSERDMKSVFKSLMHLDHPFIDKIVYIQNVETGTYVIKKIHQSGTLKDRLYGMPFKNTYLNKYGNPKQRKPFTVGQIAHYGKQILQGLKFLHNKGLPYGHLHTGNIVIDNQRIVLMDIENSIIGVPTKLRQFFIKHKKIHTMEEVDVYCFGHVLYEMTFADVLSESTCSEIPPVDSEDLRIILTKILSPNACKHGMPQINELLQHPFFQLDYEKLNGIDEVHSHLKFSSHIKDQLDTVANTIENRLKNDQKLYLLERRQVKIQEILSSEDSGKKKYKSKNKENTLYRSSSMNGLSPNLCSPSERSVSVASSSSTSSHTSPLAKDAKNTTTNDSTASAPSASLPQSNTNRSMLLDSICSFNKTSLNKVKKL